MFKKTIQKFISNPFTYSKLLFLKAFIYPYKYKKGESDYDAEKYWEDRFRKHGLDIRGPGDEGDSEVNNIKRYERVTSIFNEILKSNITDFKNLKVLEIGTGTGIITKALKELGVVNYVGVDITSVLFDDLQKTFSDYKFKKMDISQELINDKFDLIVIIDVIEHIVENAKFKFTMNNLRNSLKKNGLIAIAPIVNESYKAQFYERHWSIKDLKINLPDCDYLNPWDWEKKVSKIYLLRAV
jgi:2-polyprenyl-3-methyl-5-hydroxy-6-metoxy-1,4-benzoquinol methylase